MASTSVPDIYAYSLMMISAITLIFNSVYLNYLLSYKVDADIHPPPFFNRLYMMSLIGIVMAVIVVSYMALFCMFVGGQKIYITNFPFLVLYVLISVYSLAVSVEMMINVIKTSDTDFDIMNLDEEKNKTIILIVLCCIGMITSWCIIFSVKNPFANIHFAIPSPKSRSPRTP